MKKEYIYPTTELFYFEPESAMLSDSGNSAPPSDGSVNKGNDGEGLGDEYQMSKKKDWGSSPWN